MLRSRAARTAALLLLVAVVFGRIATHEFVNLDDDKFLYANEKLLPPTFAGLAEVWRGPHAHLYVPITMTAWWIVAQAGLIRDVSASGGGSAYALNPWVFHIASLLVHVVNVLLVRRILRAITRDDLASVIGAAIFAVHPLQVETVAWASELKDLLAAMFSLLAIVSIIEATQNDAKQPAAWWGGAIVCFIFALLSKPSAVTLPIVAAAVLWMIDAKPRRVIFIVLIAGLAIAAPIALVTQAVQSAADVPSTSLWARPLVAADALAFYLAKIVFPLGLTVDYGRTPAAIFASRAAYWTWIVPGVVTVLVFISRNRVLLGAWIIFVAAAGANLGLLPFDFQIVSTVADHYIYLGLLGVAIAVACGVSKWPRLAGVAAAVVLIFAVLTFIQAGRWRDSFSLWNHAIAVNPRSGWAHGNLGAAHLNNGDASAALSLLNRAAELDPNDPFAQLNLIRANLATGNTAAAADSAERLVAAYRRRADFNPQLVAAVLDRFAAAIAARGDATSAQRLQDEAARLRNP
ncbi:MAG: protein O-mannosyl-transferase [Humisphaera sp.]|nr:protein O-mannosyl-transferase [Humisphaera sp.]